MNSAVFRAWVEQMLSPALRPGDIVIMDNLAAHKVDGIAQAIADRGAELRYLPPYSPDLSRSSRPSPSSRPSCARPPSAPKTPVEHHRPPARPVPARRVRQLPHQRRLSTLSVKML